KDLLLSISHHWRQPLNVISLMTLSIEEELDENMSPSLKNSINKIEEEIQYLSETVNLFSYEYASSHQGKQSLSDAINSSLKLLKPLIDENRISINTDFNGDMELNIDRSKFLEIISNLILNVSDAKQANKKDEAELLIKTRKIGSSYIITLEDDCGGINEELLPNRLFNPYITTKDKSRDKGLGLYIARYIVENDLEGSISAQNTPNGAKFIITLPMIN
ncbi:MAG: sensor histidine kinase, partial [Campylobacterales bacterium]